MTNTTMTEQLEALFHLQRYQQRQLATELGLQLIHLQILAYLQRCNRYSDSLLVLCDYLGQSKGTVSSSVSLLETKGLILKRVDTQDKRKQHLQLSPAGIKLAQQQQRLCWPKIESKAIYNDAINPSINALIKALQAQNDYRQFGICHSCKHLQAHSKQAKCGLTAEPLKARELEQICVFHNE